MNVSALQTLIKKTPFEPFELVVSSGDRYVVKHPENCLLLRDKIVVAYSARPKRDDLPEDFAILSYLHIAAAEPANGKKHKKR